MLVALLVELVLDCFAQRLGRCKEPALEVVGGKVVEVLERSSELLLEGARERHVLLPPR